MYANFHSRLKQKCNRTSKKKRPEMDGGRFNFRSALEKRQTR
jgi:hypothetical protein